MKNTRDFSLYISFGASIAVLLICFASIIIMPVFSATDDTFIANVTIGNSAPNVSNVNLSDNGGGAIQLTASGQIIVTCNASIADGNGYQDVPVANINATLWNPLNGTFGGETQDVNTRYVNTSCTLGSGNGNDVNVSCSFHLNFSAINGTWNCTVTVKDEAGSTAANSSTNAIDQLNAMTVLNDSIYFGSMNINEESSSGIDSNVSNEGNVKINVTVISNNDMICIGSGAAGQIGAGNLSYNHTDGAYADMSANKLNNVSAQTIAGWHLDPKGIATVDTLNATKNIYWTIKIPTGVAGSCNNTITVTSVVAL